MICSSFDGPADTCFGHTGRVFGLAYHPSSHQVLASASEDETVRVWSRSTSKSGWQQASCCRGHTAEVIRVAWSPDGNILASGTADHTVRLWQVGTQGNHSYSGVELAVLSGHPEEVYGLKFISKGPASDNTSVTAATAAAVAAEHQHAAQTQPQQQQQPRMAEHHISNMLVTASCESLFLWDLNSQQMLHECAPLPVAGMSGLNVNGSSSGKQTKSTGRDGKHAAAGPAAGDSSISDAAPNNTSLVQLRPTEQQPNHQQQQQQQQQREPQVTKQGAAAQAEISDDEQEQQGPPLLSYIFSLAAAEGTSWLAGACADGMLRLWDAAHSQLQEVAAVQVHVGDMGSVCSFVPLQPWLILTISKSGQLVLQDIRLLGQALLAQQLQGPVYDMAWTVQQQGHVSADVEVDAAAGAAAGAAELQLCVVGRDSCVRSYEFSREALLAGSLPEPHVQATPDAYSGRLLALAAAADGRALAAAGEAVPAAALKHAAAPQQQQQQHQEAVPQEGNSAATAAAAAPAAAAVTQVSGSQTSDVAVAAAAAAVPAAAARRRRGRTVGPAGAAAAAVDLFSMADDAEAGGDRALLLQQQQPVAAGTRSSSAGSIGQQAASPLEGGARSVAAHDAAAEVQVPACAAAAAGILMRAPLFTWDNS